MNDRLDIIRSLINYEKFLMNHEYFELIMTSFFIILAIYFWFNFFENLRKETFVIELIIPLLSTFLIFSWKGILLTNCFG